MPLYRYAGNRDRYDGTNRIVVTSGGVPVEVKRGGTVELSAEELATADDRFLFVPSTDPVSVEPILDPVFVRRGGTDFYSGIGSKLSVGSFDVRDYGAKGNGTADDTAAIQAAIDDGLAIIPKGTFRFSQLRMKQGSILTGKGWSSVLKQLDGVDLDGIRTVSNGTQWEIRDLFLDGNEEGNATGSGIHPAEVLWNDPGVGPLSGSWFKITNVCAAFWSSHGFNMSGQFGGYHVRECFAFENGGNGFNCIMGDAVYSECEAAQNAGHGFYIDGHVCNITQCKAWWSGRKHGRGVPVVQSYPGGVGTSDGFHLTTNARMSVLTGCDSQDNTRDGFSNGARATSIVGGFADNNARYNLNHTTGYDCVTEGLVIGYGARITPTAHVNVVADQRNYVSTSRPGGPAPFLAGDLGGNSVRMAREIPRFVNTSGEPGWGNAAFTKPADTHTSLHFWHEDGQVHLGGHAWCGPGAASGTTIFTLPNLPEYRPAKASEVAAVSTAGTPIVVKINTNGTVTNTSVVPANSFLCFDGVKARIGSVKTPAT